MYYVSVKAFLASVYLLAISHESQASGLECWHCSSATESSEDFCGVTFDESSIQWDRLKEHNISLTRHCSDAKISEHQRVVCRKIIEEENGKEITRRYCYNTNKSDPLDYCQVESTNKNVKRIFCEDCLTDKCNAATLPRQSAFVVALLLPLLIAKMLAI